MQVQPVPSLAVLMKCDREASFPPLEQSCVLRLRETLYYRTQPVHTSSASNFDFRHPIIVCNFIQYIHASLCNISPCWSKGFNAHTVLQVFSTDLMNLCKLQMHRCRLQMHSRFYDLSFSSHIFL